MPSRCSYFAVLSRRLNLEAQSSQRSAENAEEGRGSERNLGTLDSPTGVSRGKATPARSGLGTGCGKELSSDGRPGPLMGNGRVHSQGSDVGHRSRRDGGAPQPGSRPPGKDVSRLPGTRVADSAPYRADLIVEDRVLVELKAVEALLAVHTLQTLTYLKLSRLPVALLINFNVPLLKNGIRRFANSLTPDSSTDRAGVAFPPSPAN